MPGEIRLGQLHAHGEYLERNDDAGGLLRDGVLPVPFFRVDDIEDVGAEDDAREEGQWGLAEMQAVPDELGEGGVGDEEDGEDEVGEMAGGWLDLLAEPGTHLRD